MIKIGDIVVLITKDNSDFDLTLNRQYEVIDTTKNYLVIDTDYNFRKSFRKNKFKLLSDIRKSKIKNFLKNEGKRNDL